MSSDLRGWLPFGADVRAEDPELRWCHPGPHRLTAPFYEEDIGTALARPFNSLFDVRTTMTATAAHLDEHPPLAPTAFIFHTGRCGSTLVAQLLAVDPTNRVVSEAAPLDAVLRVPLSRPVDPEVHLAWIRTTVGALGHAAPGERRLFVKLDSWSLLVAGQIDAAFPDVPWLFVVRDPVEVLVSQLRSPPMTLLASAVPSELFGVPMHDAAAWSMVRYGAHVQATLLGQMRRLAGRAHVIVHPELPDAVEPWLAGIGVEVDPATRDAMRERGSRHGKYGEAYTDDRPEKQASASDEVRAELAPVALPAYAALLATLDR